MHKTILNFSITTLFLVITSFLASLILTLLFYHNVINQPLFILLTNIISVIIFLLSGVLLGFKSENKGLIKGVIFGGIYLIISLLFHLALIKDTLSMQSVLNIVIKFFVLPIGSIIGVNLK